LKNMLKRIAGNMLYRLYDRHLERALDVSYYSGGDMEKYSNYFTFGFGDYKYNIILDNAKAMSINGDFTGCTGILKVGAMMNWYEFGFIYSRVWQDTPGGFFAKLNKVFG